MMRFLSAALVSVFLSGAALGQGFQQYFIDGNSSTFLYQGSSWTEGECRYAPCEFRLDGSFEASVGEWGTRYRNLSLSISGHNESTPSLLAAAEGAFRTGATSVVAPSQGGQPSGLGVFASSNGAAVGGSSVSIRAAAVSQSALDCNGDGDLSLDDVNCLAGHESRDAVFTALNLRPGDFDGDGRVEFKDFLVLSSQFGSAGDYVDGDVNGNGTIEFGDFLVLSSNFGEVSAAVTVPEPSSAILGSLLLLFGMTLRVRR